MSGVSKAAELTDGSLTCRTSPSVSSSRVGSSRVKSRVVPSRLVDVREAAARHLQEAMRDERLRRAVVVDEAGVALAAPRGAQRAQHVELCSSESSYAPATSLTVQYCGECLAPAAARR